MMKRKSVSPQQKRDDAAKRPRKDQEEEEVVVEEEKGETKYWLYVALRTPSAPQKADGDDEDSIGSEDSDDDDDEETDGGVEAVEWGEALAEGLISDRAAGLSQVVAMSSHIYDGSDEGEGEIRLADEAAEAEAASSEEDPKEEGTKAKEIVGYLVLKQPATSSATEITQLFVEPALRDRGIGRVLAESAMELSRDVCGAASVEVFAAGGSSAFYRKLGFAPRRPEDGDARCEMCLHL